MMIQAWTFDQLAKLRYYRPELVDHAVEEILNQQDELRWLVVVGAYLDGEINLGKAAELLGLHRLELQAIFGCRGFRYGWVRNSRRGKSGSGCDCSVEYNCRTEFSAMTILADNTVLSNFAHIRRTDLIQKAFVEEIVTTEHVFQELEIGIRIGRLPYFIL